MSENILKTIIIFFGAFAGLLLTLPLLLAMFESEHYYLPFGIGTVLGIICAFVLAYGCKFHI